MRNHASALALALAPQLTWPRGTVECEKGTGRDGLTQPHEHVTTATNDSRNVATTLDLGLAWLPGKVTTNLVITGGNKRSDIAFFVTFFSRGVEQARVGHRRAFHTSGIRCH